MVYGATRATVIIEIGRVIAYVHEGPGAIPDYDNRDADVRLIASAPDLALLLAEAVAWAKDAIHMLETTVTSEAESLLAARYDDVIRRAERALGKP